MTPPNVTYTFCCLSSLAGSFQSKKDLNDVEFIVESNVNTSFPELQEKHGEGRNAFRSHIIDRNEQLRNRKIPAVTLSSFTHMRLLRWKDAPEGVGFVPREYIPFDTWISIEDFLKSKGKDSAGYVLKNICADNIYERGSIVFQFQKRLRIRSPSKRGRDEEEEKRVPDGPRESKRNCPEKRYTRGDTVYMMSRVIHGRKEKGKIVRRLAGGKFECLFHWGAIRCEVVERDGEAWCMEDERGTPKTYREDLYKWGVRLPRPWSQLTNMERVGHLMARLS